MAFDWKSLKFWEKWGKKEFDPFANPYANVYKRPGAKKAKGQKSNTMRNAALAGAFGVAAVGGGTWYYQNNTEENLQFTVERLERIYDVDCHSRVSDTRRDVNERDDRGRTTTERRDVTDVVEPQRCERTPVAYIVHTDRGDFVNNPAIARGKTWAQSNALQAAFEEGATYNARVIGMSVDLPGVNLRQNIISADKVVQYQPYRYTPFSFFGDNP